jgi:iron complex outermembrane receptor protein
MRFLTVAALWSGLLPTLAEPQVPAPAAATETEATTPPPAGTAKDYAQVSLEELLSKDVAVAATKTRVDVAKAPVSVTVLTADDLRRSGAVRLADVLRTVAGLDVLESFPGHVSVSARGTSEVFVNNMLVLVDGRRLEFQVAGVPFFENAPIRMEDVKRIEVVKGPVGALYGTNALAGIISITTFEPDELPGTLLSVTGGGRETYLASVRHAGRLGGGWSYKLVGGYTYTGTWTSMDDASTAPGVGIKKGDALLTLQRRFAEGARLEVEGGYTDGQLASLSIVTNQTRHFSWPHFRTAYSRPDLRVQLTVSPQSSELRDFTGPAVLTDDARAVNLSVDRTLVPFSRTKLTIGSNVRYQRSTFTNIAVPHSQVVWGVFAQDEQTLVPDRLTLTGALGVSGHPEIETQVDGNLALVWSATRDHSVRLSAGRAHRDPSFNENFFDFRRRFGTRDGYQASNLELRPESLRSLEAGYHGRLRTGSSTVKVFAEGYVEQVRDLINTVNTIVPAGTLPNHPTVTLVQQFRNLENRDGWGLETGLEWSGGSVGVLGQYAYQRFRDQATRDVRFQKGIVEVDVWGHAVGATTAGEDYFLLNPRLGLRKGGWLFSVQAFNALDDRHVETINGQELRGEILRRAVSAGVTRTFR